mmetsp:Transcript_8638/g.23219  ORF Transcript_8638/g.23219 Transcript_8638/m.23219 type:complete len:209 (-) Transcript_8638:670-1296(-)
MGGANRLSKGAKPIGGIGGRCSPSLPANTLLMVSIADVSSPLRTCCAPSLFSLCCCVDTFGFTLACTFTFSRFSSFRRSSTPFSALPSLLPGCSLVSVEGFVGEGSFLSILPLAFAVTFSSFFALLDSLSPFLSLPTGFLSSTLPARAFSTLAEAAAVLAGTGAGTGREDEVCCIPVLNLFCIATSASFFAAANWGSSSTSFSPPAST